MTAELRFVSLRVQGFRNIASVDLSPSPGFNVISGDNGQGKTSLLEAIYFVATTRSFRTERFRELLMEGEQTAVVKVRVDDGGLVREQRAIVAGSGRAVQIDGKRPERLSQYATQTPVVVFHPGDLVVVSGPAQGRRTLLDRIALFGDAMSADHRLRYTRAMKSRQLVLAERGPSAMDLGPLEELMGRHGAALSAARARAADELAAAGSAAFDHMSVSSSKLEIRYMPGGDEDASRMTEQLGRRRAEDLRARSAGVGPHRDDLKLLLGGRTVRKHASQGQQRLVTLALKMAELECVRRARGAHPVLLLDDVSSELDRTRTGAVFELLSSTLSQVFLTTTRPELFVTPAPGATERRDWVVRSGAIERVGG